MYEVKCAFSSLECQIISCTQLHDMTSQLPFNVVMQGNKTNCFGTLAEATDAVVRRRFLVA